jgi:hypothetical protein
MAELLAVAGLDAYVLVMVAQLGLVFFSTLVFILSVVVLLPINWTSSGAVDLNDIIAGLSITNIPDGSDLMWPHAVAVYVISAYLCWIVGDRYHRYISLRYAFLAVAQV